MDIVEVTLSAPDVVEVSSTTSEVVEVAIGAAVGPKGEKGDKGDSVTAGAGAPSTIIPGVSVFIDAVSGDIYRYEED